MLRPSMTSPISMIIVPWGALPGRWRGGVQGRALSRTDSLAQPGHRLADRRLRARDRVLEVAADHRAVVEPGVGAEVVADVRGGKFAGAIRCVGERPVEDLARGGRALLP